MLGVSSSAPPSGTLAILRWCPAWVGLLLVGLAIPTDFSFAVGTLRLSPYRLVLIAAFVPSVIRLASGRAGPIMLVDWLVVLHVVWSYIVYASHHGFGVSIESGGIRMLEVGGSYLIARTTIVDERTFRGAMAMLFTLLIFLTPFLVLESVTGVNVIKKISGMLTGHPFHNGIDPRFGLDRAFGPFDHPILMGIFAASALGVSRLVALPRLGSPRARKWPTMASATGTFCSLSSGALAALTIQIGLLLWDWKTRYIPSRWKILTFIVATVYVTVDLISNRSGYHVFLHYLTFSAHTAYNRIIIFEYGIQDVWRNPFLGIGFNVWTKPEWMHSDSMDNFWLVQAVTFGIPGFLTIALAFWFMLRSGWDRLPARLARLRTGWTISVIGMMVSAATVHFWNNQFVYFLFFLGAGAWFLNVRRAFVPATEGNSHEYGY